METGSKSKSGIKAGSERVCRVAREGIEEWSRAEGVERKKEEMGRDQRFARFKETSRR